MCGEGRRRDCCIDFCECFSPTTTTTTEEYEANKVKILREKEEIGVLALRKVERVSARVCDYIQRYV